MADRKVFANQGPVKPDIRKSGYDLSHANNMTARIGRVYPNLLYDAPAGSSFKIRGKAAFDVDPLLFPIQSNIRMHQKFYKVPKRILWKNYENWYCHEGNHVQPFIKREGDWFKTGSLADYFGIASAAVGEAILDTQVKSLALNTGSYDDQYRTFNNESVDEVFMSPKHGDSSVRLLSQVLRRLGSDTTIPFARLTKGLVFPIIINEDDNYVFFVDVITQNDSSNYGTGKIELCYLRTNFSFNGHNQPSNAIPLIDNNCVVNGRDSYNMECIYDGSMTSAACSPGHWFYESKDELTTYRGLTAYKHRIGFCMTEAMVIWVNKFINMFDGLDDGTTNPNHFMLRYGDLNCVLGCDPHMLSVGSTIESKEESYDQTEIYSFDPVVIGYSYHTKVAVNELQKYYYSSIEGADPRLPINALPFRALEFIKNYFFRNERVDPFIPEGQLEPVYNKFISNDDDGADSLTPVDFFNAPYEYDLFTTCVKDPQFGNAPLVGITTNNLNNTGILHMQPEGESGYDIAVELDGNANMIGISNYDDVADKSSVMRLKEAIDWGISINDLRNVSAMQRWAERMQRAGHKYQNVVFEFAGTNPPIGDHFPEYLGGFTQDVYVGKVVNQTKSDQADLGEFAGIATLRKEGRSVKCFCSEESYIIGIIYFSVVPVYPQMLPRLWTKTQQLEYFNSQFANIGLQPVYNHQIAPLQCSEQELTEVFGYNRPFAEYVSMQDEVHGEFRDRYSNYCLQRVFGSKPELNHQFITIDPAEVINVFAEQNQSDKIKGMVYFKMTALLPIPKFAVPRII